MSTNKQGRDQLKFYLETGKRPTEQEFAELVDSQINQIDDDIHAKDNNIGIGTETPALKLDVNGDAVIREKLGIGTDTPKESLDVDGISILRGKVGIRISDPKEALHVGGHVRLKNTDILFHENDQDYNHGIGIYGGLSTKIWYEGSIGSQNSVAVDGPVVYGYGGGALGSNQNNNRKIALRWNANGNVGIGNYDPQNKLHVSKNGNSTGLRLDQDGTNQGDILALDANGNAQWVPKTSVTAGLWQDAGNNNIKNGNSGNVGIGLSSPNEKLHLEGNLKIKGKIIGDESTDVLFIEGNDEAGAYMELHAYRENDSDHNGHLTFVARGDGYVNGFNFTHYNHTRHEKIWNGAPNLYYDASNNGNEHTWFRSLYIDGFGTSRFYGDVRLHHSKGFFLREGNDKNHGISWFDKFPLDTVNHSNTEVNIDGPVIFGNGGGALGIVQQSHLSGGWDEATKKTALEWRWDKSVDFKGNILSNGEKPIQLLNYKDHLTFSNNANDPNNTYYFETEFNYDPNSVPWYYPLKYEFDKWGGNPGLYKKTLTLGPKPGSNKLHVIFEGVSNTNSFGTITTGTLTMKLLFFKREIASIYTTSESN